MTIQWVTGFLDFPASVFEAGWHFWLGVTGYTLSPPRGPRADFATLVPGEGDAYLRALGGVVGDRVTRLGFAIVCVHEGAVGPAALPRARVGVQGPAHDQAATGDGLDAEQVAVDLRPAGLAGLDGVVVAGADDQVAGAGLGAVGDADRGAVLHDAQLDKVVAGAAGQFAAQRMVGGHQQDVGAVGGQRDVGGRGARRRSVRGSAAIW